MDYVAAISDVRHPARIGIEDSWDPAPAARSGFVDGGIPDEEDSS